MSAKEKSRNFDAARGLEFITLQDDLGREHKLTVTLLPDPCVTCGHKPAGAEIPDVDALVADAIKTMEAEEAALRAHAKKRGYELR